MRRSLILRSGMNAIEAPGIRTVSPATSRRAGCILPTSLRALINDSKRSDLPFYDAAAHEELVLCEADSREAWLISAAHDESRRRDSLAAFELAVSEKLSSVGRHASDA
jgi:hypothetical protein